jgi:aquaglyceroporin related protein
MDYVPDSSAFFDEFLGTVVLVIGLLAILDKRNMGAPNGLAPVALFILVVGIGAGLGMQTGE